MGMKIMERVGAFCQRKWWVGYTALFGKMMYRDRFGLKYFLWPDTRVEATVSLSKARTDDMGVIRVVERVLTELRKKSGGELVCVDVGAFIGVITLAMAKYLDGRGYIVSFEPSAKNFGRLKENIALNGHSNIFPVRAAVSDSSGECRIAILARLVHIIGADEQEKEGKSEAVPKISVDDYAAAHGIKRINLLKIDAEGYDDKVLVGLSNLLEQKMIDYIIVEFIEGDECSKNALKILTDHGYKTFFIVRHKGELVKDLINYPRDKHKPPLNLLAVSPNGRLP